MNKKSKYSITVVMAAIVVVAIIIVYRKRRTIYDVYKQSTMKTYFTVEELLQSETARIKGIENKPTEAHRQNLEYLITKLNEVREKYGKPIIVSSGYRSEALNKAIGGAENSQHSKGQAADLVPATGGNLAEIFYAVLEVGGFGQLIWEQNAIGNRWVHVSFSKTDNRGEILDYDPKRTGNKYTDISKNYKSIVK